ncbi:MAG: transcription termination/antitermination factor NusG [Elusimicrobia bacterium CG08_land_8_20_14_0_20_51_18]|nr:MAG: transcription termination/antitermination factor NusG [Elusimicrobia bacterium CG08_land_8_20_14_0_20_51_18]
MAYSWYILNTRTGYEDKVQKAILSKKEVNELPQDVNVLIPTENVIQVKNNKKEIKKRKFFPGYILIYIELSKDAYWTLKTINGISGFLGDPAPTPLTQEEVDKLINKMDETSKENPKPAVEFDKGESVRITEGPFKHFMGIVEEVNLQKSKLKVIVTVFDRPTPVELDFLQVEKV